MKYTLVPTEKGKTLGKKPIETDNIKQATFAKVLNPDCYEIVETADKKN